MVGWGWPMRDYSKAALATSGTRACESGAITGTDARTPASTGSLIAAEPLQSNRTYYLRRMNRRARGFVNPTSALWFCGSTKSTTPH